MIWNEPCLVQYEFKFGAKRDMAVARIGFPHRDEKLRGERVCSFQIDGLKDSEIHLARGDDGLLPLTIASTAIQTLLGQLKDISSDSGPYEFIFHRHLPFCCGLDFHKKLCGLIDAEISKKQNVVLPKSIALSTIES